MNRGFSSCVVGHGVVERDAGLGARFGEVLGVRKLQGPVDVHAHRFLPLTDRSGGGGCLPTLGSLHILYDGEPIFLHFAV
ncbi:MAG TPA: hypothetical protein VGA22_12705 [Gemmatimonadales bacterium]